MFGSVSCRKAHVLFQSYERAVFFETVFSSCVYVSVILFHVRCFEPIVCVCAVRLWIFLHFFFLLYFCLFIAQFSLNLIFVYQKIFILMWSWSQASFSIPNEFRIDKYWIFRSFCSAAPSSRNRFSPHTHTFITTIGQQLVIKLPKNCIHR